MPKYGLDYSPLSDSIQVGRINKAGNAFLDKEDKTQEFIRSILLMYGGKEVSITDKSTGKTWIIRVTEEGATGAN